ncbi:MAG: tetratricopeptide repeat protein, partial [Gemmataceae bacterium]|nr:tetratricopeptide repeat protein [Gemmataceae bacterium]
MPFLCLVLAMAGASKEEMGRERDRLLLRSQEQAKRGLRGRAAGSARIVARLTEAVEGRASAKMAEALENLVDALLHADEYREAASAAAWLLRVRERIGSKPWQLTDARNWLRYSRRLAELTEAELGRFRQASLDFHEADQFVRLESFDRAAALFKKGLDARRAVMGYEDHVWIERQTDWAFLLRLAGDKAAKRAMALALARQRALAGEQHKRTAIVARRMARLLQLAGDLDEAAKLAAYAANLSRAAEGPGCANEKDALRYLAETSEAQAKQAGEAGRHQRSAGHFRTAAEAWRRIGGVDAWRAQDALAWGRDALFCADAPLSRLAASGKALELHEKGSARLEKGKTAAAVALLGDAVRRLEAASMLRYRVGLICLWDLGSAHLRSGDEKRAVERFDLCLRWAIGELGAGNPFVTSRLDSLLRWRDRQIDTLTEADDLPGALAACADLRRLSAMRYPGEAWRLKTIDWRAEHLRDLAKLAPAGRERIVAARKRMDSLDGLRAAGRNAEAAAILEDVLADAAKLPETDFHRLAALDTLCYFLLAQGRLAEAETAIRRNLELRARAHGKEHSQYAFALQRLGALYGRTGNRKEAARVQEEVAAILARTLGDKHRAYAEARQQLAGCHLELGRPDLARAGLDAAHEILKDAKGADRADLAQVLNTLAGLYEEGVPELAASFHERAAALWRELKDDINAAIALDNLGGIHRRLGDEGRSAMFRREALKVFRARLGDLHPTTAVGFANVAASCAVKGEHAEAARLLALALKAEQRNFALVAPLRTETQQVESLRRYRTTLAPYLAESARADVSPAAAWEQLLAWKGLSLLHQQQARLARAAPELQPLVAALQAETRALAAVALDVPPSRAADAWRKEVARRTARRDEAERKLAEAAGTQPLRIPSADEVRKAIPADAALLDFFVSRSVGEARLGVFVVRSKTMARLDLGPLETVSGAVERWRAGHGERGGHEVARLLWLPVLPHLA